MAGKADEWQGDWGATQGLLHIAGTLVAAPLAGAAGALIGGREHRQHTGELLRTTTRPPLARVLVAALPTAVWAALGQLAVVAGALLASWPYASGGRPVVSTLLVPAVLVLSTALLGYVTGAVVRVRLAPPLFGVAVYAGLGIPGYSDRTAAYLSPASWESVVDGGVPVWWQPLVAVAWAGGSAVAAVLVLAARRRWTALVPLTAAAVAGVLIVQTDERMWRDDPLVFRPVCDTSAWPELCVPARYPGMLPDIRRALEPVTDRLAGVEHLPVRLTAVPGDLAPGEERLPALTPLGQSMVRGRLTDPEFYAWGTAASLVHAREGCTALDEDQRYQDLSLVLREWLGAAPGRTGEEIWDTYHHPDTAAEQARTRTFLRRFDRLETMEREERRRWLSAYFGALARCAPDRMPAL